MGFSSSKQEDKKIKEKQNKYFTAYKRVKRIHEDIHNKVLEEESGIVQDVYLIKISTIPKYLNILKNWKILEKIAERQRSEVHDLEEKLKNDFKDYEPENNIKDCIDISKEDFKNNFSENFVREKFIIVDKKFNEIMKISDGNDKKVNINVNKYEIKIDLPDGDIIIIEETEKGNGIYKFVEIKEKDMYDENETHKNEEKEEKDPDTYKHRIFINNQEAEQEEINEKEKNEENLENKSKDSNEVNLNKEQNSSEDNNNSNNKVIDKKEKVKAPFAKYDEIISSIYFSIPKNINEQKERILEKLKKIMEESNISDIIEEKHNIDIINNIKESVKKLLKEYNGNQNSQNLDETKNVNETYNSLIDNDDEKKSMIDKSFHNNNYNNNQKIENPFNFNLNQVPINQCDNCGESINFYINDEKPYSLDLNEKCNNLEECFNLEIPKKCGNCQNNIKFVYKFESTPKILIIKFNNPKVKKKFINLDYPIEKNIDLKSHLSNGSETTKYELITTLYVFNDINDNKLYVDIPESEYKNYIPFIIIYKKIEAS